MVLVYDKQAPYENETPYGAKHPPKANLGLLPALVNTLRALDVTFDFVMMY